MFTAKGRLYLQSTLRNESISIAGKKDQLADNLITVHTFCESRNGPMDVYYFAGKEDLRKGY